MRALYNELIMQKFGEKYIKGQCPSGGYFLWVKFNDTTLGCEHLCEGCARLKQIFEEYDNIKL